MTNPWAEQPAFWAEEAERKWANDPRSRLTRGYSYIDDLRGRQDGVYRDAMAVFSIAQLMPVFLDDERRDGPRWAEALTRDVR